MDFIKDGKLNFSLLVADEITDELTIRAINEFCLFIRKCTDKDQPVDTRYRADKNFVVIGENLKLVKGKISVPYETFGEDTAYFKIQNNLIAIGGKGRGVLYSVYEFFERILGVRFYAQEKYLTPRYDNLIVEDTEFSYTPAITYREVYAPDFRWNREFSARNRGNSENSPYKLADMGGGALWALPNCHTTFKNLLNPYDEEFGFAAHPEFYSYRKDEGCRVAGLSGSWGNGEVCWSNDKAIEVITDRLKEWILSQPRKEIFSVSQNDWESHCECPECEKTAYKYGENGEPRYSAPLVLAINKIARNIKEWQKTDERVKNRKIIIETFAYKYSTLAPVGLEVEDNVMIRLCTHECCFNHAFEDESCPVNREFIKSLNGWEKITSSIYVWDYATNSYFDVAYNTVMKNLQKNIRFFAKHKIIGVFEEFAGTRFSGLFPQIRQYMLGALLWNPDIDYEKELEKAFDFFYGRVGKYVLETEKLFWKLTDETRDFHPRLAYTIYREQYPDEFLNRATELFEKAIEESETEEIALRVKRDYVCLKFIKMYLNRANLPTEEIKKVTDEFDRLGISFGKMEMFKEHFFNGKLSDFFLSEIELRNKNADAERIRRIIEDRL